ncbi:MAG: NAD(P)/FAD-dependent oxidoreductase [Rhodospirillaceae bacterium]|nr:NAD(P)/FAD-dependent oxidoreductase [Rhodospirillaceae bacterium]
MTISGLAALEARVRKELALTAYPTARWVPPRPDPDGSGDRLLDVLVVGGGQAGQTIAFQLRQEGVDTVRVIDRAPAGLEGPWLTYARMRTLRSPKEVTGPDLGLPSLTFQAWYEAQHGEAGWRDLGKISVADWAAYLLWLREILDLPVENEVCLQRIDADGSLPVAHLRHGDGRVEMVRCRKLVLAHGIEASGHWWTPPMIEVLEPSVWAHTSAEIDFTGLRGKRVAVLGVGSSAMDNAATALEAGASRVEVFCRRPELQRVQPFKWLSFSGFFRHFHALDDDMRWAFMRYLLTTQEAFPKETWERCSRHEGFALQTSAPWLSVEAKAGGVEITTPKGLHQADFLIIGTGFEMDLKCRPELEGLADKIALWADRYTPAHGEENDRLSPYPYLDPGYRFQEKEPGQAPVLANIHLFTYGTTMSFGPSGASINAMKFSVPQVVAGITQDLFTEDAALHLAQLKAYQMPEFLLPGEDGTVEAPRVPAIER